MMYQILDQTAKALLPPCDEIDYVSGRQEKFGVLHRGDSAAPKENLAKKSTRAVLDDRLVLHGESTTVI